MATQAIAAIGTQLLRGDGVDGSSVNYTPIAEVKRFRPPNPSIETHDVTALDSTGGYREFISGLKDGGEFTIDMNLVPGDAGQANLRADFNAKVRRDFKCIFPDVGATEWLWTALITKFESEVNVDGVLEATVSAKISGEPTLV